MKAEEVHTRGIQLQERSVKLFLFVFDGGCGTQGLAHSKHALYRLSAIFFLELLEERLRERRFFRRKCRSFGNFGILESMIILRTVFCELSLKRVCEERRVYW